MEGIQRTTEKAIDSLTFYWNGRAVSARRGDTIASALWRHGVVVMGASRKRHRPLGLSGAFLQGELVQVDGTAHVRAGTRRVTPGLDVRQQSVWPSARFNMLKLLRYVPARWVAGGFERSCMFPGGTRRFQVWERLLMFIAGEVTISPGPRERAPALKGSCLSVDTAIVGGGLSGRLAANESARAGARTVLISPSASPGLRSNELGLDVPALDPRITVLTDHTVVGAYRSGRLLLAVPHEPNAPATIVRANRVILATGRRSCPPLVPGLDLPGVVDVHTAMNLVRDLGAEWGPVAVVGTGAENLVASALRARGVRVVVCAPVQKLSCIRGRGRVDTVTVDGKDFRCRALVHAGPWLKDDSLRFQASSSGTLRLIGGALPGHVEVVGSAAEADEAITPCDPKLLATVSVCPCMDVTAGEIAARIREGEVHIEELKRSTGCGMGPCQGFPCWALMGAVVRSLGSASVEDDRPTHRPPRGGITVRQAAGLDGLVDLE